MCLIGEFQKGVTVPRAKAIKAYRAWYGTKSKPCSLCYGFAGWRRAGVPSMSDSAPSHRNQSGFWAFRLRRGVKALLGGYDYDFIGPILLWGEIAIHKDGYRAQYAMIPKVAQRKK